MTMETKKELLEIDLSRYLKADKQNKGIILDNLESQTSMNRKSLIRAFKRRQMKDLRIQPPKRGRKETYGPRVNIALEEVWKISNELCAERLHPNIKEYINPLKRDKMWNHANDTTKLFLKMSLGTMKDRIANFRKIKKKKNNSTTTPGKLKHLIPIRRGPWKNPKPGFGEIDTVVHCGETLCGNVAFTVNYTDIATTWYEAGAQLNKSQRETLQNIKSIEQRLPFDLLGLDPDTGSEFINWHVKKWCDKNKIELSRSRPNHKNDNAHIEQKNYTNVRNFLGNWRIDTEEQIKLMNQLYSGPLRLYINFFQPSVKCIKKEKVGSKYIRKYDKAKMPYQRVLENKNIDQKTKNELTEIYKTLNPLKLKQEADKLILKIFNIKKKKLR